MLRSARFLLIAAPTAVLTALALVACSGGSGGDSPRPRIDERGAQGCEQPLPPGQGVAVTTERFQTADDGLAEMEHLAQGGDLNGARDVFFSQVHSLTHDIDGGLRNANPPVARELCAVIGQIEVDFAAGRDGGGGGGPAAPAPGALRPASRLVGS